VIERGDTKHDPEQDEQLRHEPPMNTPSKGDPTNSSQPR